jgi:hypothetical protein
VRISNFIHSFIFLINISRGGDDDAHTTAAADYSLSASPTGVARENTILHSVSSWRSQTTLYLARHVSCALNAATSRAVGARTMSIPLVGVRPAGCSHCIPQSPSPSLI